MMHSGDVDKKFRSLDLGVLPPWQLNVTLSDGEKQYIKIPYSEGSHVVGLPLGLDVPKVIALNYKTLLCMINGMTSVITSLTLKLERQEKVAAHYLDDVNRYRLELEELKSTMGWGMAVPQAPVSPSKKRKLNRQQSGPCDTQTVCIEKSEHLPPPISRDGPAVAVLLVQQSVIEEDIDVSDGLSRAKHLRGENVPTSASLTCSDVQTENVESDAWVVSVGNTNDATMTSTSANCLTVDSTSVSGQGEHEGFECLQNCESDDIPTFDCTTFSTPIDITPPHEESTSVSGRVEDELFAYVENFKIPKPEQLPPPKSNYWPATAVLLVQESIIEEIMEESDDLPLPREKCSRCQDVPTSASLICSEKQTDKVESVAGVVPFGESVDATTTSTSANWPTADSATLSSSTPVESTSVSSPLGNEWFEYVENFKIPKVYADLYKKISSKYGNMVTKKAIKSSYAVRLVCITSLMEIASRMETVRGVDLSAALLESWEGDIKVAETLQFNIKWLREIFGRLKSSWKTSFSIDKEVESCEQVLDAEHVNYVSLISRKDELEAKLAEVKINIRKSEAKISSEREAIRIKMAEKYIFLFEPVLGTLFS